MARLTFRLLGTFEATLDGEPVNGFVSDKARGLLAYLLVESNRPHRRETLAGLLWPDYPERSARTSLRRALASVRAVIGDRQSAPPCLLISRQSIQVNPESDYRLDVDRFRMLAEGQVGGSIEISDLEEALRLYRGDFMEGFSFADSAAFEEWLLLTRESLRRQVVRNLFSLTKHYEALGATERALQCARRQVALEPYRESGHRQVMRLLALGGQRSEALAHYEGLRRLLATDLHVLPAAETQDLRARLASQEATACEEDSEEDQPEITTEDRGLSIPAQLTRFVGRQREMAQIAALMADSRLVTLTGPPGIGKSRLALEVVSEIQGQFDDGVHFVDLAVISEPEMVIRAISRTMDLKSRGRQPLLTMLKKYLRSRRTLLLLDNFEQVIEAGPLIGDLLAAAPGLSALVTSREPLQIYGEQQYSVPPLQLPDPTASPAPVKVSQCEAVTLFIQRASAVRPAFAVNEENAAAVADICIRLDGLPLAIELAAARCKLFTAKMIQARMKNRLAMLTGGSRDLSPRQRALRAAIDWSYDLLDASEQKLFARLSVFQGGRTIVAAEQVCAQNLAIPVIEGLESLLNKSLIRQVADPDGEPRFIMLETIHEYARECLERSGETEEMRQRHAEYFVLLAEEFENDLFGAQADRCCARLRAELENLLTALQWSLKSGNVTPGLRLAGALREFWYGEGLIGESLHWLEGLLVDAAGAPAPVRAKALNAAGLLATAQGDHDRARQHLKEALALARQSDDEVNTAWALVYLGGDTMGNPEEYLVGIAYCQEALTLFRKIGNQAGAIQALTMTGELARLEGDYDLAQEAYEECLTVCRKAGHQLREALTCGNLISIAIHQGDYDRAEQLAKMDLALSRELGLKYYTATGFALWAGPMAEKGNAERATRLLGAADALLEALGLELPPSDQVEVDSYLDLVREQLTADQFEAAWAQGRAMSMEEAFAYASGDDRTA